MNARIQVGIRLRPFLESEISKGYTNTKIRIDKAASKISIVNHLTSQQSSNSNNNRVFEFDHIFDQSSKQEDIYDDSQVSSMVTRVLDGFHSTIFAYGQTGSGKTYTMEGKHENGGYASESAKGIVARTLDDLFSQIANLKAQNSKSYYITCSFLQIYNEKIYDLLSLQPAAAAAAVAAAAANSNSQIQQPPGLKLRWNAREQFQVENLFVFEVKNPREAQQYFLAGVKNRITASHKLNMTSSRSHTIFTITVNTYTAEGAHETSSKLQLVDLAGSERIALSGTEGKMAKESIDINKSLFTLRQVITALSEINQTSSAGNNNNNAFDTSDNNNGGTNSKLPHIPYRESKLTSLLKQSIGGNCYCLMMACIVPNDAFVDENVSTLHYATRATYIKNQPIKNEDPNKQMLSEVTNENANLRSELEKANAHIAFLTSALQKSEKTCQQLRNQLGQQQQQQPGQQQQQQQQQQQKNQQVGQQGGGTSREYDPFAQEQQNIQHQKDLFNQQAALQEQHSKLLEERMLGRTYSKPFDADPSSTSTAFVHAHQFENSRQHPNAHSTRQSFQPNNGINNNKPSDVQQQQQQQQSKLQQQQQQQSLNGMQNLDQDNFNERLIESITLVRQLLESNKELRQQTDIGKLRMRQLEQELSDVTSENQKLQDFNSLQLGSHSKLRTNRSPVDQGEYSDVQHEDPATVDPRFSLNSATSIKRPINSNPNNNNNNNNNGPIEFKNFSRSDLIQEILDLRLSKKLMEGNHRSNGGGSDLDRTLPKLNSTGQSYNPTQSNNNNNNMKGNNNNNSNSTLTSSINTGRTNYAFYSTNKKRGISQQQQQSQQQQSQQLQPLSSQRSNMNSSHQPIGSGGNHDEHTNRSHTNIQNMLTNRQQIITDSVPTNFGRYTIYQQNVHHFEKMQQMSKLQQSASQLQDSQRSPLSSQKIKLPVSYSGYSSQDDDGSNPNMHEAAAAGGGNAVNQFKANSMSIPSSLQQKPVRSNSFNKSKTTSFHALNDIGIPYLQPDNSHHSDERNIGRSKHNEKDKIKSQNRQSSRGKNL